MDSDLLKQGFLKFWMLLLSLSGFLACTSKPEERIPDEQAMHYPYSMALNQNYLAVSSSSADGKYDFGRLVILDTVAIKNALAGYQREPIPWGSVVRKNFLVPQEMGEITYSNKTLVFANRENGQLSVLPVSGGLPSCKNDNVQTCSEAKNINLFDHDPFSIQMVQENTNEEIIAASYLSSDRIDLIKISSNNQVEPYKNFRLNDWLRLKLDEKILRKQRFITKNIQTSSTKGKVYFLVEQQPEKMQTLVRPKASYIVAIKISDLVGNDSINASMIELWSLADFASINGVRDFYIDDTTDVAYILASVPEALYKVNLVENVIVETSVVCAVATKMAVNKDQDQIVIGCFKDNRVASYSMSTLGLVNVSGAIGRGPAYVVIDKANGLIYCTLNNDGALVILDEKLNYLGHVFNKAPLNRIGS